MCRHSLAYSTEQTGLEAPHAAAALLSPEAPFPVALSYSAFRLSSGKPPGAPKVLCAGGGPSSEGSAPETQHPPSVSSFKAWSPFRPQLGPAALSQLRPGSELCSTNSAEGRLSKLCLRVSADSPRKLLETTAARPCASAYSAHLTTLSWSSVISRAWFPICSLDSAACPAVPAHAAPQGLPESPGVLHMPFAAGEPPAHARTSLVPCLGGCSPQLPLPASLGLALPGKHLLATSCPFLSR